MGLTRYVDDLRHELAVAAEDVAEATPPPPPEGEDGPTARINFRLPEHLKLRIEEAAGRDGLSVNAGLVRAVAATVDSADRGRHSERRAPRGRQRYTGWVH